MTSHLPRDSFLTVAEVAERLRVNPHTVRNWIGRGLLPAVRVGQRRIRVRQSEFDRFVGLCSCNAMRTREHDEPKAYEIARLVPPTSGPDARDRFLRAAMDLMKAALGERPAELGPALRALARCAEVWADALDR